MAPIAIGRIRKPFGLDGSVKVLSFSGEKAHFRTLSRVVLSGGGKGRTSQREYRIETVRVRSDELIIRFTGIESREDAKNLSGLEILVDRSEAAPLGEDEIYLSDLIGLKCHSNDHSVGMVTSYYEGPQGVLLEVKTDEGVHLVPYQERFVVSVDWKGRILELREMWILE